MHLYSIYTSHGVYMIILYTKLKYNVDFSFLYLNDCYHGPNAYKKVFGE